MTDTTPATEEAPAEETPWSPFPDQDAAIFTVSKKINEAQLHQELEEALDQPVQMSTSRAVGADETTLWVVPGSVDAEAVQAVLDEHTADAEWGVPSSTRDYIALVRKVIENPDYALSAEEVQTAVKGLILRLQGTQA